MRPRQLSVTKRCSYYEAVIAVSFGYELNMIERSREYDLHHDRTRESLSMFVCDRKRGEGQLHIIHGTVLTDSCFFFHSEMTTDCLLDI